MGLLVVDEGHRLKSATRSQTLTALESLSADARLCITATPIQNNLKEFYALAHFCCPGSLGDSLSFRKDFEHPIAAANQKNATREQLAYGLAKSKELELVSKTFMLRRLQKDVLKSMIPPRTEALLFCRPSSRQCQLYCELSQRYRMGSNMADALTALTSLRKICSHPLLYQQDDNLAADPAAALSVSGKLMVLDALLQQIRELCPDDKVVIVSNFTSVLSLIESLVLQPRHFAFSRLDGSTDTQNRQALVDTFNRANPMNNFCLLLSSKAGGVGLNLVGANKLVMFGKLQQPLYVICAFIVVANTGVLNFVSRVPTFTGQMLTGIPALTCRPWGECIARVRPSRAQYIACFPQVRWKKSFTNASPRKAVFRLSPWTAVLAMATHHQSRPETMPSFPKKNLVTASL